MIQDSWLISYSDKTITPRFPDGIDRHMNLGEWELVEQGTFLKVGELYNYVKDAWSAQAQIRLGATYKLDEKAQIFLFDGSIT